MPCASSVTNDGLNAAARKEVVSHSQTLFIKAISCHAKIAAGEKGAKDLSRQDRTHMADNIPAYQSSQNLVPEP